MKNMKHKLIHTIAGVVAMLLLFGCQADETTFNDNSSKAVNIQPVLQVQSGVTSTRTTPGGQGFSDGDIIGISLAMGARIPQATDANHSYMYSSGTWTTQNDDFYWLDNMAKHTFRAYYPYEKKYDLAVESANFEMPVNADGAIDFTEAGAWTATDKAWGMIETTPTNEAVSIPMTHRMSQIIIKLQSGDHTINLGEGTSVELLTPFAPQDGYARVGQFDIIDGTISIAREQPANLPQKIQMLKGIDDSFYALVLPGQTFKAGAPFACITDVNGKTYIYNLALADTKANLITVSNESIEFTLNVVKSTVSGIGVTAEAWATPTEVEPEGEDTETEDTWLNSLTKIECSGGDLLTKLEAASNPTKIWITGSVNATDIPGYKDKNGLSKYILTHNVTDLCLDAEYTGAKGNNVLPNQTFRDLTSLKVARLTKVVSADPGQWGCNLFSTCTALETVVLTSMTTIQKNMFPSCSSLKNVIIPLATSMETPVFNPCIVLDKLVVRNVAAINVSAFNGGTPYCNIFCIENAGITSNIINSKTFSSINGAYTGSTKVYDDYLNPANYTTHYPAN